MFSYQDGRLGGVAKAAAVLILSMAIPGPLAPAQRTRLQVPCPVMLVSGEADRDNIQLSFRNKGKAPIQEISFSCSPALHATSRDAICHTERGIFYPGTQYSTEFANISTGRRSISIAVKTARLGDGSMWISRPSASCHPLTIRKR